VQIGRDHDRSARSVGASWIQACWHIITPQIRPALLACFAILFIHFMKEYAVAIFLFGPDSEVMGTTMLAFWVQGENGSVAALAVLQMAIMVVFMILFRRALGVRTHG